MRHIIVVMMKRLPIEPSKLAAFCEANGIRKLSLFGSQLHGTARADSDVDLLVEFYPDRVPGLFALAGMEFELSDMLGGKKVDLRTPSCLSRYFRDQVVNEAAQLYGN
jgi:predicted nucleotidyltransferase